MARISVSLPNNVADWVQRAADEKGMSQSAFVSNMLSFAMGSMSSVPNAPGFKVTKG